MYNKVSELPQELRDTLPPEAQELYMEVYNTAWKAYGEHEEVEDGDDRDTAAHSAAWDEVSKEFVQQKNGGSWEPRTRR